MLVEIAGISVCVWGRFRSDDLLSENGLGHREVPI